ncbi:hypothetical protein HNR77_004437 [Paenibacillus sp. JGP012]|nr:hypothetical protein [Paenibacillus sp. JGP012]
MKQSFLLFIELFFSIYLPYIEDFHIEEANSSSSILSAASADAAKGTERLWRSEAVAFINGYIPWENGIQYIRG